MSFQICVIKLYGMKLKVRSKKNQRLNQINFIQYKLKQNKPYFRKPASITIPGTNSHIPLPA